MQRNNLRIVFGVIIVITAMVYFGISGFQEGKAYYKTIEELDAMGSDAYGKRIKVAGIVTDGTVVRRSDGLHFRLEQNELNLSCIYTGSSPVPDTFKGGVEAVCEGRYREDGTFETEKIQAKCASKYQSEYGKTAATGD
ncbi:MAG: cytochrome c maturation protein CcmE [Candidatus Latescibacterota bacterium]|nr:MAG: cytochrome c maturation protein CcmE [Candidatus Latescibacterota bacterium]